jgi:hypothetical protein
MAITQLPAGRTPLLVASHERSGTHFTMNALAACFGFVSAPWVDFDQVHFNINFFSERMLTQTLRNIAAHRPANLIKSHHAYEFFAEALPNCRGDLAAIYVYRHPADALASYWRFLHGWAWTEGPRCETLVEFALAEPMGRLMRLQYRQHASMLDRWAHHVSQWVEAAERSRDVHLVRYEDLDEAYEPTVRRLGAAIGVEPAAIARPSRHENVIKAPPGAFAPAAEAENRAAVTDLARSRHPELMARLGYGALPRRPSVQLVSG